MPEGDVVRRTARRLDAALAGATLTVADLRVPALATTDLVGHDVEEVVAVGKHLLVRIAPALTLHAHLRMDGAWNVFHAGDRWDAGPGHEIRVVLGNERWTVVGYRVHDLALVRRADEPTLVGHLGPDILDADWDAARALRHVGATPGRAVGEAMLDQRCVAGIGNLYACEALFLSGVDPWLPCEQVADLAAVLDTARRLMSANLERTTQATTGDTRPGREHWVYRRSGRPCRRCGTTVRRAEQGPPLQERARYWCPTCQPGAGPSASSVSSVSTAESEGATGRVRASSRAAAGSRRPRRD